LPDYPISVYYAFKQAESETDGVTSTGWDTLLQGMVQGGWTITATWPMRSELANRMRSQDSNALASSIVLTLRPRPESAPSIDRRGFLASLKAELPRKLRELQQGAIAPVDLAQAAIGPGMQVFSRFTRVLEADGNSMTVRTALKLIDQAKDEVLTEQEGDFDADTRFCVRWFTQFGWSQAAFGQADTLARATNTSVKGLEQGGVLRSRDGKVSLIAPPDFDPGWDPMRDNRLSIWEATVQLAARLNDQGTEAAADLLAAISHRIEPETIQELAYLLYTVSDHAKRSTDAQLFNTLGSEWSHLSEKARSRAQSPRGSQGSFDLSDDHGGRS
jgi:putative DNA methylase